jgi:hypothetical protein
MGYSAEQQQSMQVQILNYGALEAFSNNRLIKIWWSFEWRVELLAVLFGLLLVSTVGVAITAAGVTAGAQGEELGGNVGSLLGLVATLLATLIAFRLVLRKQFGDFSLRIMPEGPYQLLRAWWAFLWRRGLLFFLIRALLGQIGDPGFVAELFIGMVVSFIAFKLICGKTFKTFSLRLVPRAVPSPHSPD